MNFVKTYPAVTALFAAFALSSAGFAAAGDSGLSRNEHSAQQAIADTSPPGRVDAHSDARIALATNERAAQSVIVADFASNSVSATVASDSAVALSGNERAAQRAIVDAPRGSRALAPVDSRVSLTGAQRAHQGVAR